MKNNEKKMNRAERRTAEKATLTRAERKNKKSKKAIYAAYDIEYKKGKIYSPINGGMWITPPLVNGNDKIGKGAWHFSMLPGNITWHVNIALTTKTKICTKMVKDPKTGEKRKSANYGKLVKYTAVDDNNPVWIDIDGTCACLCRNEKGEIACYAFTGNYQYDTTKAYLAIRTILAREFPEFLERAIMAQIEAEKIELCRIHAAGDFFGKEYAAMWKRIAIACQGTIFWTYTKVKEFEKLFNGIENANIVKSVIPGFGFNFGHCDYIMRLYKYLKSKGFKVHICFCGIEKYAGIEPKHCTNCKSCSECDYVLFIEHSTEYKAEKDPLFPELVKLILAQE